MSYNPSVGIRSFVRTYFVRWETHKHEPIFTIPAPDDSILHIQRAVSYFSWSRQNLSRIWLHFSGRYAMEFTKAHVPWIFIGQPALICCLVYYTLIVNYTSEVANINRKWNGSVTDVGWTGPCDIHIQTPLRAGFVVTKFSAIALCWAMGSSLGPILDDKINVRRLYAYVHGCFLWLIHLLLSDILTRATIVVIPIYNSLTNMKQNLLSIFSDGKSWWKLMGP